MPSIDLSPSFKPQPKASNVGKSPKSKPLVFKRASLPQKKINLTAMKFSAEKHSNFNRSVVNSSEHSHEIESQFRHQLKPLLEESLFGRTLGNRAESVYELLQDILKKDCGVQIKTVDRLTSIYNLDDLFFEDFERFLSEYGLPEESDFINWCVDTEYLFTS